MRHVCEPLSLDELEKAFNGQAVNRGIINIIKLRDKFSPRCDDSLLEHCDLLVFRESDTGLAPSFGDACMGLRAFETVLWSARG